MKLFFVYTVLLLPKSFCYLAFVTWGHAYYTGCVDTVAGLKGPQNPGSLANRVPREEMS